MSSPSPLASETIPGHAGIEMQPDYDRSIAQFLDFRHVGNGWTAGWRKPAGRQGERRSTVLMAAGGFSGTKLDAGRTLLLAGKLRLRCGGSA